MLKHFFQAFYQRWYLFVCVALLVLLDQWSKAWAQETLVYAQSVAFVPYFNFTLLHNYGAAFSLLADQGGWQRIFLAAVALLISLFLLRWMLKTQRRVEMWGLALVLAGALGNLYDRLILGYVVDFIDWFYHSSTGDCWPFFYSIFSSQSCHWPAFNLADSAIFLGALCLLLDMFMAKKTPQESANHDNH